MARRPYCRAVSTGPDFATIRAGVLDIEFIRSGDPLGWPVVLLHGFPYGARGFDRVAELLSDAGADVVVPWLRGYGGKRPHRVTQRWSDPVCTASAPASDPAFR